MRRAATLLLSLVLVTGVAACTSDDDAATTTASTTTSTTEATTEATTTAPEAPTTTGDATAGLPADCEAVLQQYVDVMNPDELQSTAELFRTWAPDLPPEVAAAAERLADAYEEAGSLDQVDVGDPSLGADAQTLSTWMDSGCPAP